jgi:hypothetical protein
MAVVQYAELDHDCFLQFVHQVMKLKYRRGNLRIDQEVGILNELICGGSLARQGCPDILTLLAT